MIEQQTAPERPCRVRRAAAAAEPAGERGDLMIRTRCRAAPPCARARPGVQQKSTSRNQDINQDRRPSPNTPANGIAFSEESPRTLITSTPRRARPLSPDSKVPRRRTGEDGELWSRPGHSGHRHVLAGTCRAASPPPRALHHLVSGCRSTSRTRSEHGTGTSHWFGCDGCDDKHHVAKPTSARTQGKLASRSERCT